MARKTTRKTKPKTRRARPKLARKATSRLTKPEHTYYGLTYNVWINVILLVAIILIVGILAGIGSLVQKTSSQEVPTLNAIPSEDIGIQGARTLAGIVLDKVVGKGAYNITSVTLDHGVYKIDVTVMTNTGTGAGSMYLSKDGKKAYFRGIPTSDFLKE